jgi:RHS repeat-associated protein
MSGQKTALWGFENQPSGSKLHEAAQSPDFAMEAEAYGYESAMGRAYWLSRDPIGERGGINLYGMVGNDAVNRVDHLGLITVRTRAKEPGECGAYTVGFDFSLDQLATTDGYMIQEVSWTLKLRKAGGGFETTSGTFYESWPISKGTGMTNWRGPVQSGNTVVQSTDISGRKGGECTEGSYEAKGTIRFHSVGTTGLMPNSPGRPPADIPGPWAPNTGFSIGGVPQAGTLPSSPDQPPWWNNPSPNAEKEGSRRVFAEWNCVPPIAGSGRQTKLTVTP